jgi:hypothetical protein
MRIPNWPHALAEYIRERQEKPFEYGVHDCAHFAAGAVQAITEEYPKFPNYKTEHAALTLIAKKSLQHRTREILGEEVSVNMAQRGDIVMFVDETNGPSLGVCFGANSIFPSKHGLLHVKTADCLCAWRIE